jgi:outer membrane protein assembly factor BamD
MRSQLDLKVILYGLVIFIGLGCSSGPEQRPTVSYRVSAKENFIKGKKALEDENYLEAIEFFRFVKNKFPYSAYSTESDLLLADCQYGREHFLEAADAYANFIKLHPKHKKVPYAMFRIGMSYYERIPGDWWFLPPVYELDSQETKRTINEFQRFISRFPNDQHVKEAKEKLDRCRKRLAQQVHYVMNFYWKKNKYQAVVWRAEELLKYYHGLGFDEEALYRKAQALHEMGEDQAAKDTIAELKKKFPNSEYSESADGIIPLQQNTKVPEEN